MAHVGTITGSMVLDPSAYIAGLNRAAQHTAAFQSSIQAGTAGINAFAKASQSMAVGMSRLNGSVYASMTAFYALSRVVSSSLGVFEEYNNIIARISATADLSISSVTALSESFKKLNRELGGSRTDLMKGVYRAVQANFTTPGEFMPIGAAAMRLRTASGREIDTTKSADVISVIRNALGIKSGREGFITDMLLRGRDIGRYELTEMVSALGIPITLFGNQFSAKLGPEETLRQLIAILSSATQTGLNPRTAATGTRRMIEKTTRLMKSPEGIGKNLTTALRSMGFSSISEALNQGPMAFLETISRLTGGRPEALTQMGYGSRDIMLLTSALRNNMGQTRVFYGKLAPGEIGGTTDKYLDKHKQTWWYQRDRLRSAYEDSQLKLMEAMIPVLSTFANSLEVVNDLFQALAPSIKQLIGLITLGAGTSILKNFFIRGSGGGVGGGHNSFAMSPPRLENFGRIGPDFFSRGIRKPVIGTPAQRTYGNQIYSGFGNIFRIAHPSYYGGGISSVGWRPLDSNNAQGQLIPIIPMTQKKMPYNIQILNRKYNSAFMNPNAKHLNRVQIKSKPFSVKAEQQRAIDLYNWNLQREALIAQNRARSQMLRDKYVKMQREHYAWGPERNAFGGPKYILRPVSYTLPPIKPTLGTHLATNKDWMPRSALFNAVRNNISTFPERMLDRVGGAAMWASNALNNLPSYGSIPGMTSAIKAGAFMFGGQDYRIERIQDKYNSRIAAANEALKSERMSAHRSALGLYKTLTGAGMSDMRAAGEAANYLNKALDNVNEKFNQTAASAQRSARNMSGVASAFSTLGSVANMAKIGVIIKVVSDLIDGLNLSGKSSKHADVVDLSKAGTDGGKLLDLNDVFRRWSDDIKYAAAFLEGYANLKTKSENTDLIMPHLISRRASLGYVLNEDYNPKGFEFFTFKPIADRLFKPATLEDAMKTAFRENLSPKEQTKLTKAGYNELTPKVKREFEDYLMSGKLGQKYRGVTEPGWGQRTNIEEFGGKSGYQVQIDFFTSFLKEMSSLGETIKKTTSSVKSFNMSAKQTDHIFEYLKINYREYFSRFISGAKQIETRGMLYDQQADRSLTPNEQSIWQSSGYREKMALAASGLFTPKHRFGDEDRFASFEDWAKQQKENERYSGFGEYEDAKRNYFKASSDEQTASMLAVLLPKLATLSTSDARKQLWGIYGRNLNLDDVGIDRLRNIDLSRYFSEKPRDQLNSKSQFMSYGTTETYNSIFSMTPPEITELQANRKAILDLQEAITQNSDELLQDFDDKFEKFVADKLDKIVDNTAFLADVALFGNPPDFVPSLD